MKIEGIDVCQLSLRKMTWFERATINAIRVYLKAGDFAGAKLFSLRHPCFGRQVLNLL
jgi:hypothetical protein